METLCLIKTTLIPLVALFALLGTNVSSIPLPSPHGESSAPSKSATLTKCLESLQARKADEEQSAASAVESKSSPSLPTDDGECKDILDNILTGDKKTTSSSSSISSGILPADEGRRKSNSAKGSLGGEQTQEQLLGQNDQPLSRRSRDIGHTKREMVLRAQNMISQMIGATGVADAVDDGTSRSAQGTQIEGAYSLALAKLRALAGLKKALLRSSSQIDNARLLRLIAGNPSVVTSGEKVDNEEEHLEAALRSNNDMDEDNALFSPHSPAAPQDPDFSSAMNNEQTPWAGQGETTSEGDVMSGPVEQRSDYSGQLSRGRFVQKRNRNTLSVNNAMMAITNMLLAEQKERLQRNRHRIRQHMLIQG